MTNKSTDLHQRNSCVLLFKKDQMGQRMSSGEKCANPKRKFGKPMSWDGDLMEKMKRFELKKRLSEIEENVEKREVIADQLI